MDEFKVIVIMNEAMIEVLKEKNANYDKNTKIGQYLEDEAFFFKISQSNAYEVLKNVGVNEKNLEDVYKKLTSPNSYYDLVNRGKIKGNEDNLVVKYDNIISSNDLFKKTN